MRPVRIRLGVLAAVTVFLFPCSTTAQTTTILTRRLRNCGSFWPISARCSIARLESSKSRDEH